VSARSGKVAVSKYELLIETTIYEPGMKWSGHSGDRVASFNMKIDFI
jgi:hypothetical protein